MEPFYLLNHQLKKRGILLRKHIRDVPKMKA